MTTVLDEMLGEMVIKMTVEWAAIMITDVVDDILIMMMKVVSINDNNDKFCLNKMVMTMITIVKKSLKWQICYGSWGGENNYHEGNHDFEDYIIYINIFNIFNDDAVHGNYGNADFDDSNLIEWLLHYVWKCTM